jgi:hypothetical protein
MPKESIVVECRVIVEPKLIWSIKSEHYSHPITFFFFSKHNNIKYKCFYTIDIKKKKKTIIYKTITAAIATALKA